MSKQSKIRKDMDKKAKEILKELNIPVEDFFNYYSVPWDKNLYVKFPVKSIIIHYKETKMAFKSSFEDQEGVKDDFEKYRERFMSAHYLGSARETDVNRLKFIIGERTELKT